MKILHIASEYPPQQVFGLGRFVRDLAVETAAQGHDVHVVTNSMGGRDHDITDGGVHVHRVDFPPPPKPHDSGSTVIQFNTQAVERAVPLVREIKPDVVASHDWLTYLAGRTIHRVFGIPHVLTMHDTTVGKRFGKLENPEKLAANLERLGVAEADLTVCCSQHVRNELIQTYGARDDRVRVIPCAVDEANFAIRTSAPLLKAFRKALAQDGQIIILYVGRLDLEKGLEVLLNAIPEVLGRHREAKFVIAGKGLMEESIREWIDKTKLANSVLLTGYVAGASLSHVYRVSDVQVVPSRYEPFGIVALEGMINGLPVVASASGGLADIVENDVTGFTVPPGSAADLARAISRLVADSALRKRLGEAGRQRARTVYNWRRVAELTIGVYEEARTPASEGRPVPIQVSRAQNGGTTPMRAPRAEKPRQPEHAVYQKTWILLTTQGQVETSRRAITSLSKTTHGDHEIIVVDSGGAPALIGFLSSQVSDGTISRLILNRNGTVPLPEKGYAIAQAVNALAEEAFEYFAWADASLEFKPGWIEAGLKALQSVNGKAPVVVFEDGSSRGEPPAIQELEIGGQRVTLLPSASGGVWLARRSFFSRFGMPPIGVTDGQLGDADAHYTRLLSRAGCAFAVIHGFVDRIEGGQQRSENAGHA